MAAQLEVYSNTVPLGVPYIKKECAPKSDKRKRQYARLIFCLLAANRWQARKNTKWADFYKAEIKFLRKMLHGSKAGERKPDRFDASKALSLEYSKYMEASYGQG